MQVAASVWYNENIADCLAHQHWAYHRGQYSNIAAGHQHGNVGFPEEGAGDLQDDAGGLMDGAGSLHDAGLQHGAGGLQHGAGDLHDGAGSLHDGYYRGEGGLQDDG